MKEAASSEMLVTVYQTTWCHITDESNLCWTSVLNWHKLSCERIHLALRLSVLIITNVKEILQCLHNSLTLLLPVDVQGMKWPAQNSPEYYGCVQVPHMQTLWPRNYWAHEPQQVSSQSIRGPAAGCLGTDESALGHGMPAPGPVHFSASNL